MSPSFAAWKHPQNIQRCASTLQDDHKSLIYPYMYICSESTLPASSSLPVLQRQSEREQEIRRAATPLHRHRHRHRRTNTEASIHIDTDMDTDRNNDTDA